MPFRAMAWSCLFMFLFFFVFNSFSFYQLSNPSGVNHINTHDGKAGSHEYKDIIKQYAMICYA